MSEKINKNGPIVQPKVLITQKEIEAKTFFRNSIYDAVDNSKNGVMTKEEYLKEEAKIKEQYKNNGGDLSQLSTPSDKELKEIFNDNEMDLNEAFGLRKEIIFGGVNLGSENLKEVTQDNDNKLYTAKFKDGVEVSYQEQEPSFQNFIDSENITEGEEGTGNVICTSTLINGVNVNEIIGTPQNDHVAATAATVKIFHGRGGRDDLYASQ